MGNVHVVYAFTPESCSCGTDPFNGLEFNSSLIQAKPVMQVFWVPSDLPGSPDHYTVQFSLDGANQGATTFQAVSSSSRVTAAVQAQTNVTTTGWHDYEYVTSGIYITANDAVSSNY